MDWKSFYLPVDEDGNTDGGPERLASEAFERAKTILNTINTDKVKGRSIVQGHFAIEDVYGAVLEAQELYNKRRLRGKAWQWLSTFSSRVQYYSPVMDALAQHHPEYVALAWGTIKLLTVALINHEDQMATLTKVLSQIGDHLPRHALILRLYPTVQIKNGMAFLYAKIMEFLISALEWYQAGRLKHIYHAVAWPVAVRYKSLLEEIVECSRSVDQWAVAASQVELRDVHKLQTDTFGFSKNNLELTQRNVIQLDSIQEGIGQILKKFGQVNITQAGHSLPSSGPLTTSKAITGVQIVEMLERLADKRATDHFQALRHASLIANRQRALNRTALQPDPFWFSPKLQTWATDPHSSTVFVHGSFASRFKLRDFEVALIQMLKRTKKFVLWVLPDRDRNKPVGPIHAIQSLVLQATLLNESLGRIERSVQAISRLNRTSTEEDWMDVLFDMLIGLPIVYIVFNINSVTDRGNRLSWPGLVQSLTQKHTEAPVVKILFSGYGDVQSLASQLASCGTDQNEVIRIDNKRSEIFHAGRRNRTKLGSLGSLRSCRRTVLSSEPAMAVTGVKKSSTAYHHVSTDVYGTVDEGH